MEKGEEPEVFIAAKLVQSIVYSNKGGLMAGIIVGGWDAKKGPQCYNIPLGGAMTQMPVAIGGSDSTYVWGLVDSEYKQNMTKEEARTFALKVVSHAMYRDGSSGGCVRMTIITGEGTNHYETVLEDMLPISTGDIAQS